MFNHADYAQIAATYDVGRPILEHNLQRWLDLIDSVIGQAENVRLLDLGCGTGRFSIPIAERLNYKVVGADYSADMIALAKSKPSNATVVWEIHDAQRLKFPDSSFDAIFASHLLDHLDDPSIAIRECLRVLRPGGKLMLRYKSIEDLRKDPEHTFFQGANRVDEERMASSAEVEEYLQEAGFRNVNSTTIVQQTYREPIQRLETNRTKARSVLTLIPESAFEVGLSFLSEYIEKNPSDPWLLIDALTFTVGVKPGATTVTKLFPVE